MCHFLENKSLFILQHNTATTLLKILELRHTYGKVQSIHREIHAWVECVVFVAKYNLSFWILTEVITVCAVLSNERKTVEWLWRRYVKWVRGLKSFIIRNAVKFIWYWIFGSLLSSAERIFQEKRVNPQAQQF